MPGFKGLAVPGPSLPLFNDEAFDHTRFNALGEREIFPVTLPRLAFMAGRDVNQLPVVQNDALVGIVSRDAIVHYLEIRRSLGGDTSKSDAQNQLHKAA